METNRIESIAQDGIQTAAQIARTIVQASGEVTADAASAINATVLRAARETAKTGEESSVAALTSAGRVLGSARDTSEQLIGLVRTTLGGLIEVAGTLVRTAVRVSAEVVNEVVYSVRSTVYVVVVPDGDGDRSLGSNPRPANGHTTEFPA
jgi:hypothetical protein